MRRRHGRRRPRRRRRPVGGSRYPSSHCWFRRSIGPQGRQSRDPAERAGAHVTPAALTAVGRSPGRPPARSGPCSAAWTGCMQRSARASDCSRDWAQLGYHPRRRLAWRLAEPTSNWAHLEDRLDRSVLGLGHPRQRCKRRHAPCLCSPRPACQRPAAGTQWRKEGEAGLSGAQTAGGAQQWHSRPRPTSPAAAARRCSTPQAPRSLFAVQSSRLVAQWRHRDRSSCPALRPARRHSQAASDRLRGVWEAQ